MVSGLGADMEAEVLSHFSSIFAVVDSDSDGDTSQICYAIARTFTVDHQMILERDFTEEEVRVACFQIGPNKAPGPVFTKTIGIL